MSFDHVSRLHSIASKMFLLAVAFSVIFGTAIAAASITWASFDDGSDKVTANDTHPVHFCSDVMCDQACIACPISEKKY